MKYFLVITIISIFLSGCIRRGNGEKSFIEEIENNTQEINIVYYVYNLEETFLTMYVNAQAGLRVRNQPDLNSDRIGLLDDQSKVYVITEYENSVSIDGIDGRWTFVVTDYIEGWVFGGFLSQTPRTATGGKIFATMEDAINYIFFVKFPFNLLGFNSPPFRAVQLIM